MRVRAEVPALRTAFNNEFSSAVRVIWQTPQRRSPVCPKKNARTSDRDGHSSIPS